MFLLFKEDKCSTHRIAVLLSYRIIILLRHFGEICAFILTYILHGAESFLKS